MNKSATLS